MISEFGFGILGFDVLGYSVCDFEIVVFSWCVVVKLSLLRLLWGWSNTEICAFLVGLCSEVCVCAFVLGFVLGFVRFCT